MEVSEGLLYLGGISADSLLERFGSPLYVYEEDVLISRFRKMRSCFPPDEVDIHYAMKANYNPSLLSLLCREGACIDAVSSGDVKMALEVGFDPHRILFTGNNSRMEEINFSMSKKVPVNLGSLELLQLYGNRFPGTSVSIRVNPGMCAGHHSHCITGGPDSKFGIYRDRLDDALKISEKHGLKLSGIHSHIGTGIRKTEAMIEAMDLILDSAKHFPDLEFVDFGSGFKVPYFPNDSETNIEELGNKLSKRFNSFCKEYGKDLTLMFEPGKFLVSESGKFLCKVNSIKQTTSTVFAQVDSGFNHFLRPMMYGANHHIENISNHNDVQRYYSVVGYICETDTFATNRKISTIRNGDLLCFNNAGAYCHAMSSNYNSRYRPCLLYTSDAADE